MGERWGKMGKKWVKNGITGVQKTALMHASAHLGHAGAGRRAGAIDRRHPLLGIRAHREQRHALLVLRLGLRFLRLPHRLQDELELLVFASRCDSWGGGLEPKG